MLSEDTPKIRLLEKRVEKLEKLMDALYSLDVIQNYTKYRKIREDYERNRIIRR